MQSNVRGFWCLSCLVLAVACQPEPPEETPGAELSEKERQAIGVTGEQPKTIPEAPAKHHSAPVNGGEQAALDLAMEALSKKMDLTGREVSHQRVQATEWPSSALGCPEPGVYYLDVIVPGYLVTLTVDGKSHAVHVGNGRAVVCDPISPELAAKQAQRQAVMTVYQAARVDLADRLKTDPAEIKVTHIKPQTWEDSSLGCPAEGVEYELGRVEGFLINLECRGQAYEYHSDKVGTEFILCGEFPACPETE